jgi:hypothetical protein
MFKNSLGDWRFENLASARPEHQLIQSWAVHCEPEIARSFSFQIFSRQKKLCDLSPRECDKSKHENQAQLTGRER